MRRSLLGNTGTDGAGAGAGCVTCFLPCCHHAARLAHVPTTAARHLLRHSQLGTAQQKSEPRVRCSCSGPYLHRTAQGAAEGDSEQYSQPGPGQLLEQCSTAESAECPEQSTCVLTVFVRVGKRCSAPEMRKLRKLVRIWPCGQRSCMNIHKHAECYIVFDVRHRVL